MQQPHPPVWVAASRSDDTYRWAGEQGFHLLTLPYMYEPEVLRNAIDHYRQALVQAGTILPPGRCWASSTSTSRLRT